MRLHMFVVLTFLFATDTVSAQQHCHRTDIDQTSGFCTVPDPALTPGEMDASLACISNGVRPRHVTPAKRTQSSRPTAIRRVLTSPNGSSTIGSRIGWEFGRDKKHLV